MNLEEKSRNPEKKKAHPLHREALLNCGSLFRTKFPLRSTLYFYRTKDALFRGQCWPHSTGKRRIPMVMATPTSTTSTPPPALQHLERWHHLTRASPLTDIPEAPGIEYGTGPELLATQFVHSRVQTLLERQVYAA